MQVDHVFSRVREDANGKETEVTNKEGCFAKSTGVNRLKDLLNE